MVFIEILIVFFIALLVAAIFSYGFRNRGPWGAFWIFLLILFLGAWAARIWVTPVGPVFWGVAWIPVVFAVIIFALLLVAAAAHPVKRREEVGENIKMEERGGEEGAAVGVFFWFLLLVLVAIIIAGIF